MKKVYSIAKENYDKKDEGYSYIYNFHQNIDNLPKSFKVIGNNKTYKEKDIIEIIKKLVIYFDSIGIKRGSRVALISKNEPYFLFTLYALFYLKAIPVSIDRNHEDAIIDKLIKEEPFIITDKKLISLSGKLLFFSRVMNEISRATKTSKKSFLEIINKNQFNLAEPKDPFIILCSSGTTGLSKKIILSEKNILWADKEYARLYDFKNNDSIVFMVPSHYSLGILACGIIPFFHKKTILICDGKKINNCLEKISQYKINILPATPLIYNLMSRCNLKKYNFSHLRVCDSGGQILPISIIKKFAENTGVTITEGYGLTETSSLTHFLVSDSSGKLRLGSMGKPCTGVKCKIINEHQNEEKLLIPGELLVKGPQNMLGYSDENENKKIFTEDGWLKTGDIVYKDNDDFYYYVSRKIDLCGYKFVNSKKLRDIEEYLYSLDIVKECAILVSKNKEIIIFIKPDISKSNYFEVKKYLAKGLASFSIKGDIKLVDSIPRTSTHKVKRTILREKYK